MSSLTRSWQLVCRSTFLPNQCRFEGSGGRQQQAKVSPNDQQQASATACQCLERCQTNLITHVCCIFTEHFVAENTDSYNPSEQNTDIMSSRMQTRQANFIQLPSAPSVTSCINDRTRERMLQQQYMILASQTMTGIKQRTATNIMIGSRRRNAC